MIVSNIPVRVEVLEVGDLVVLEGKVWRVDGHTYCRATSTRTLKLSNAVEATEAHFYDWSYDTTINRVVILEPR